jgi:tetratricopeptide (TPR) repeat protein
MRLLGIALGLSLWTCAAFAQSPSAETARIAQQRYKAGVELMSSEKFDEAVEEFKDALAIDRLMAMAHYNIGQCRMAQKRYVEAVAAYQASRDTFEELGSLSQKERDERERLRRDEMNELRDDLQRLEQGRVKNAGAADAVRMGDRLRQLENMQFKDHGGEMRVPAGVYLALGSAYFRQQKLEDAEREYRLAIKSNPKMGEAHNNLAVVLFMTQRLDEARQELELAKKARFKVNPKFEEDLKNASAAGKGTR